MIIKRSGRSSLAGSSAWLMTIGLTGLILIIAILGTLLQTPHPSLSLEPMSSAIRPVTAYNVGVKSQTDAKPCISATRENLCQALAEGEKVCAANFVPLNTYLYVQHYGIYRVADRMNGRFKNGVDIAMKADQKERAAVFGVKYLRVTILKKFLHPH